MLNKNAWMAAIDGLMMLVQDMRGMNSTAAFYAEPFGEPVREARRNIFARLFFCRVGE